MSLHAQEGLLGGAEPFIVVRGWYWMHEHYDGVADVVCDAVFAREKRTAEFREEHSLYKEIVQGCFTCEGRQECDPEGLLMLDGPWVIRELYDAFWARLRWVRRFADWERMAFWVRITYVHALLYKTFERCALIRTHDYLNLPVPPEPPFQMLGRNGTVFSVDFSGLPPAKTYGPLPGDA